MLEFASLTRFLFVLFFLICLEPSSRTSWTRQSKLKIKNQQTKRFEEAQTDEQQEKIKVVGFFFETPKLKLSKNH
jgi:hypothetical protein